MKQKEMIIVVTGSNKDAILLQKFLQEKGFSGITILTDTGSDKELSIYQLSKTLPDFPLEIFEIKRPKLREKPFREKKFKALERFLKNKKQFCRRKS